MSAIDLVVTTLALALVVFTVIYNVRKKRRGDSPCAYCKSCTLKDKRGCHS